MNKIRDFRTDSPLTDEQWKFIDAALKRVALQQMIGRRIAPVVGPYGLGVQAITYDKMTETGDAEVNLSWQGAQEDDVSIDRTTTRVPVIQKGFRLNYRNVLSSRRTGTPLEIANGKSAAYKVSLREDEVILDGYAADGTNYDVSGFYQLAGNTEGTAADYGTSGKGIVKTNLAAGVLRDDNIFPPYNQILNPVQFNQLNAPLASTGILEADVILRIMKGQLLESPSQTVDTGMMMSAGDRGFYDISMSQDLTTEFEQLSLKEGKDIWGVVYESLVPRAWEANAICTLTAI